MYMHTLPVRDRSTWPVEHGHFNAKYVAPHIYITFLAVGTSQGALKASKLKNMEVKKEEKPSADQLQEPCRFAGHRTAPSPKFGTRL